MFNLLRVFNKELLNKVLNASNTIIVVGFVIVIVITFIIIMTVRNISFLFLQVFYTLTFPPFK